MYDCYVPFSHIREGQNAARFSFSHFHFKCAPMLSFQIWAKPPWKMLLFCPLCCSTEGGDYRRFLNFGFPWTAGCKIVKMVALQIKIRTGCCPNFCFQFFNAKASAFVFNRTKSKNYLKVHIKIIHFGFDVLLSSDFHCFPYIFASPERRNSAQNPKIKMRHVKLRR